jgi:O-antigen/teichoic acid export membrane protein
LNSTNSPPATTSRASVLRSTSVLAASQLVTSLLAFLTQRIVLSTFTKDENGAFFLVQQLGSLVMVCLVEAGMTTMTMGMVIRDPDRADAIIATLFKLRLLLWCGATAVLLGLGWWYGVDTVPLFLLFALSSFFTAKIPLQRSVLEIRRRAVSDQVPPSLAAIAEGSLLLALVWFDREHLSALSVLLWMLVASVPSFTSLLLLDKQGKRLRVPFDAAIAREIVRSSFPVFVVVVLQQFHTVSDALFLDFFASKSEVGVFGAVFRVIIQSLLFVGVFTQAMFPTLSKLYVEDLERCKHYALQGVRAIMLFGVAFGLFASSVMPWVIRLSSGATYEDNIVEFFLFTWAVVPAFVQGFLLTFNTAITWQRRNYAVFTVLVLVSLLGNLTLTPLYHVHGIARVGRI